MNQYNTDSPAYKTSFDIGKKLNQAIQYHQAGQFQKAQEIYNNILEINPNHPEALNLSGIIANESGDNETAVRLISKAISNNPNNSIYHNNLGNALRGIGKFERAIESFERALQLKPNLVETHNNLGNVMKDLGRLKEAISCFQQAIRINPNFSESHYNLSLTHLVSGNFLEGWQTFGWRLKKEGWQTIYPHRFTKPLWDGKPFTGKKLFIHSEQGLGDAFQFVRYLPMIKDLGGTVLFEARKEMLGLLQNFPGIDELAGMSPTDKQDENFDFYVPLLSLPGIFRTTLETIPAQVPYIFADTKKVRFWQNRLSDPDFKVGLVWKGSPAHKNDRLRSCSFEAFAPLATVPGLRLYGIQKRDSLSGTKYLLGGRNFTNLGEGLNDFTDTSGLIANMDLIISVDTSVAHLAGAMGKPVWVLLPYSPDWRWMLDREDSPWYPTMRLFRQPEPGDWETVFFNVAEALQRFVQNQKTSNGPNNILEIHTPSKSFPFDIEKELKKAFQYHQSGELDKARVIYENILEINPNNSDALHLLGVIVHQTGKNELAVDLISRAIKISPEYPSYHNSLGLVYKDQNKNAEAIACYENALKLKPDLTEAYNNLGVAYQDLGKIDEAMAYFKKALELSPHTPEVQNNMGNVHRELGKLDEAIGFYKNAVMINADYAEAHFNMGNTYHHMNQFNKALACYQNALDIKSDYPEAYFHKGNAYQELNRIAEAIKNYEKALQIRPEDTDALDNMGKAYRDMGRLDEALSCYEKTLAIEPKNADAHFDYSVALLLNENYEKGWKEYEWRFFKSGWESTYSHRFDKPRWDGSPFSGKRLFVHDEQGLGDTIQFVRYLPMVKDLGGEVIFEVKNPLLSLFQNFPGIDRLVEWSAEEKFNAQFDYYLPLLSIPGLFETTEQTIPEKVPYIHANSAEIDYWHERLSGPGFKVGLVWAGKPASNDNRPCELRYFSPLAEISGIELYGLQKGEAAAQVQGLPDGMHVSNLGEELHDFADTAGVIENLDLIISIDTSVTHLAGAMGKTVWTLLPFAPDWRWLLNRDDSTWYPTMSLFRQAKHGDWETLLHNVAENLRILVQEQQHSRHTSDTGNKGKSNQDIFPDHPPATSFDIGGKLNEAVQLHRSGQLQKAWDIYEKILEIDPENSDALHLLGLLNHYTGNNNSAYKLITKAIQNDPEYPFFHNSLGLVLKEMGRLDEALSYYKKALELKPDYTEVYNNMGIVFQESGRLDEAVSCYKKALVIDPHTPEVHNNLGNSLKSMERLDEAISCYAKALELKPDYVDAINNLGAAYENLNKFEQSISCYEKALQISPDYTEAHVNMGITFQHMGELDKANSCYQKALAQDPQNADAHFHYSFSLLLGGELKHGWKEYEWRLFRKEWKRTHTYDPNIPKWDGESFKGKTLFIHAEQGLGDTLQFVRYLPLAKDLGGKVIFETSEPLAGLFQDFPGIDKLVIFSSEKTHDYDLYTPLLSIPGLLETSIDTIPADVPYIHAAPSKVEYWGKRLPEGSFKIGLVWAGKPATNDNRPCELKLFSPLAEIPGISLIGLQKGEAGAQVQGLPDGMRVNNLGEELRNLSDTAAVIENLDLIISIDTSVAHLAGAMGKQVWTLLPFAPDWRWLLDRADNPWYPTMRLFRQKKPGNWDGVLERVVQELEKIIPRNVRTQYILERVTE